MSTVGMLPEFVPLGVRYVSTNGMGLSPSRRSKRESFFSTLKEARIYGNKDATNLEARRETFHFIEEYYSGQPIFSYLGHMSPVEFKVVAA